MIADAERFKEEDERCRQRVSSRNTLESYLFSVRTALRESGQKLDDKDRAPVETIVEEEISWLENNREKDAEIYDEKYKKLQKLVVPTMEKIHKKSDEKGPTIQEVN